MGGCLGVGVLGGGGGAAWGGLVAGKAQKRVHGKRLCLS